MPFKVSHYTHPALQIFVNATRAGWSAHLGNLTARWTWSLPESKLYINYLERNAVFLALKLFQDLCSNKKALPATDNTIAIAHVNKEESGFGLPA